LFEKHDDFIVLLEFAELQKICTFLVEFLDDKRVF